MGPDIKKRNKIFFFAFSLIQLTAYFARLTADGLRASTMAGCKPAESLLAEREQERERSGRLAKRRLEAGGYTCAAFLLAALLLRRLRIGCNVLLAAAAAFNGSQAGVYFAGSRLYHCTCSYWAKFCQTFSSVVGWCLAQ